jgi:hypothetical protein
MQGGLFATVDLPEIYPNGSFSRKFPWNDDAELPLLQAAEVFQGLAEGKFDLIAIGEVSHAS